MSFEKCKDAKKVLFVIADSNKEEIECSKEIIIRDIESECSNREGESGKSKTSEDFLQREQIKRSK